MLNVTTNFTDNTGLVKASDMKPMQLGTIADRNDKRYGDVVMRTQGSHYELMNLSKPMPDRCWSGAPPPFLIKLLEEGSTITLSQTT